MKSDERAALKTHIEAEIRALREQMDTLEAGIRPVAPDDALGRLTRLDAMQSVEMNQNTYRQAQQKLAGLEAALARIDDPDFGRCVECDAPIPMGRLKIVPGTRHCVACA